MKIGFARSRLVGGRTLTRGLVAAGAAAALLAGSPAGAAASAPSDEVTGTIGGVGTVNSLTLTPAPHVWNFSGTGYLIDVTNPAGSGTYTCSATLSDSMIGTTVDEAGAFSGSCTGPLSIAVSNGTFVRHGTAISAEGSSLDPNGSERRLSMVCDFVPAQIPPTPITNYLIECSVTFGALV